MADIAELGIRAESDDIPKATKRLRDLQAQGGRTETATSKLEKETEKLNKTYAAAGRTVGKVIGLLAGGLFTKTIIGNTIAQEQAVTQLNSALRSTGVTAPGASTALQQMASSLQQITTFGDEATLASSALLLTFKQVGGAEFPRAQKAILDVATAMGTDLQSATLQIGKALNDPVLGLTALSRSGIQFTETQKEAIKTMVETGDVAGAQVMILAELESQFGGSAEAARNTFGGAMTALKNTLGDLLEGSGGSLNTATQGVQNLEAALGDPGVKNAFQSITGAVLTLTGKFASGIAVVVDFARVFGVQAAFLADQAGNYFMLASNAVGTALFTIELKIREGFAAVLTFVSEQLSALAAVAGKIPFGDAIATQLNNASASVKQFGADSVAVVQQSIDALQRDSEARRAQIAAAKELRDEVIDGYAAEATAQEEVNVNRRGSIEVTEELSEATKQLAEQEAKRRAKLDDDIKFQKRINELMREGRTLAEARFAAEFERADSQERALMVEKAATDALVESQKRAEEATKQAAKESEKSAKEIERAYEQTTNRVEDAFRDVFNNIGEGFGGLVRSIKDGFKKLLVERAIAAIRNKIIVPISTSITGGGVGGLISGAQSLFGGGGGGIGNIISVAKMFGTNAIGAIGDGIFKLGGMLGSATVDSIGVYLSNNAAALSAAALPIAGAIAGAAGLFAAGRALTADNSRVGANTQGAAALLAGGPALALSGLDKATGGGLFGTKFATVGEYLALSVEDGVVSSMLTTLQKAKKSGFRGNKYREWTEEFNQLAFQSAFEGLNATLASAARLTGVDARGMDVSVEGDLVYESAADVFDRLASTMIDRVIPNIEFYRRENEQLVETFARLVNQTQVLSNSLMGLNTSLGNSVQLSNAFIERFGEGVAGAFANLQNVLLTEQEKAANLTAQFTNTMADLGFAVPPTRAAMLELVRSLDLTTDAGGIAAATLAGSAQQIDQYYKQVESAAENAAAVQAASMQAMMDAIQAGMIRIKEEIAKSQAFADDIRNVIDSYSQQVFDDKGTARLRKNAQEEIQRQIDEAMSIFADPRKMFMRKIRGEGGKVIQENDALNKALGDIQLPSENLFASFEDYQRDYMQTLGQLAALEKVGLVQKSIEELQLEQLKNIAAAVGAGALNFGGPPATRAEAAQAAAAGMALGMMQRDKIYGAADADLMLRSGSTDTVSGFLEQFKPPSRFSSRGVARFATGGLHSGGMAMVGENGRELIDTGPARIYSSNDTSKIIDWQALANALVPHLTTIAQNTQTTATHVRNLDDQIDDWDRDGLPEERTV